MTASDVLRNLLYGRSKDEETESSSRGCFPFGILVQKVSQAFQLCFGIVHNNKIVDETTPLLGGTARPLSRDSVKRIPIKSGIPVRPLKFPQTPLGELLRRKTPEISYYSVESYCSICRRDLPRTPTSDCQDEDARLASLWQWDLLAICPWPANGPYSKFLAAKLDLKAYRDSPQLLQPMGYEKQPTVNIDLHVKSRKVKDRDRNRRQEAFTVHRTCWKLVHRFSNRQPTNKLVYEFGKATKTLARTRSKEDTWNPSIRDLTPLFESLDQGIELQPILRRLSTAPAEIENAITEDASNNLLASMIYFFKTTLPLLRSYSLNISKKSEVSISSPYGHLTADWINVYGHLYIQNLSTHNFLDERKELALIIRPIRGIQLDVQAHGVGISGIRLLYTDGTESIWLGNEPSDQVQTILGTKITGLIVERDGLKITKISIQAANSWYIHQPTPQTITRFPSTSTGCVQKVPYPERQKSYFLSTPKLTTSSSTSSSPFGTWRLQDQRNPQKRNWNNWRLSQALQVGNFHNDDRDVDNELCGITVYFDKGAVVGIATHVRFNNIFTREADTTDGAGDPVKSEEVEIVGGTKTTLLGARGSTACALFLSLAKDEVVTSVWSAKGKEGDNEQGRCLPILLQTNHANTLPCIPITSLLDSKAMSWNCLTPHDITTPIIQLFHDGTSSSFSNGAIPNLGITKDKSTLPLPFVTSPYLPQIPILSTPREQVVKKEMFLQAWNGRVFLSRAMALDHHQISKIEIRRRGERVLGVFLSVLHLMSGVENPIGTSTHILGQWDLSFPSEISTLYDLDTASQELNPDTPLDSSSTQDQTSNRLTLPVPKGLIFHYSTPPLNWATASTQPAPGNTANRTIQSNNSPIDTQISRRYITSISLTISPLPTNPSTTNNPNPDPDSDSYTWNLTSPVAWYFTPFSDYICPWEGSNITLSPPKAISTPSPLSDSEPHLDANPTAKELSEGEEKEGQEQVQASELLLNPGLSLPEHERMGEENLVLWDGYEESECESDY